jgi:hypothetical protein
MYEQDYARPENTESCRTDLDARILPIRQHLVYRMLRDKAQIPTAWLHFRSFGLELMAGQV